MSAFGPSNHNIWLGPRKTACAGAVYAYDAPVLLRHVAKNKNSISYPGKCEKHSNVKIGIAN